MDRLLVGRDAECVALRAGLAASQAGPGSVILVAGEGERGKDVRRMLAALLGATPQPTLTAVVASRADGLPFAVEELAAIDRLAVATHLRAAASYSAALATLSAARADAEASGRTDLVLRAEGLRGNVLSRLGQSREGIAAVRAALDQALAGTLSDTAAELQQRLADSLEHSGAGSPNSAHSRSPRGPDGDYPSKLTGTGLAADPSVLTSTTVASRRMASDALLVSAPSPVSAARAPASEAPPHGPAGMP
jgi:hypothetical protein